MENIQQPQMVPVSHLVQEEKVAFYKNTYTHVAGGVLAFIIAEFILLQSTALKSFYWNNE
ncbi:hypothetical protein [Pseudofulvibacter geojedonensis]|uniref:Uncharacterized protein n=1 Tax=Pseudofulvibacter geojedonensis TaxID=1123758 RepID=A0ABW3HYY3_9FLAO